MPNAHTVMALVAAGIAALALSGRDSESAPTHFNVEFPEVTLPQASGGHSPATGGEGDAGPTVATGGMPGEEIDDRETIRRKFSDSGGGSSRSTSGHSGTGTDRSKTVGDDDEPFGTPGPGMGL